MDVEQNEEILFREAIALSMSTEKEGEDMQNSSISSHSISLPDDKYFDTQSGIASRSQVQTENELVQFDLD